MFFVASKVLGLVFQPVNFLILVALFGVVVGAVRSVPTGFSITAGAVLVFAVVAFSPLSAFILRPLEDRFPRAPEDMPAPAGIIVLGGALDSDLTDARRSPALSEAASRLTAGVALARRYPAARLVFTGGSAALKGGVPEAQDVRALWVSLGVDAERIVTEDRSRNTYENAAFTKVIVAPRPGELWLLVTSAAHMPRSVGIFRRVGWPVLAYPVDYRTFGDSRDDKPTAEALDSLRRLDVALHEWIGLVAYRLTGKTEVLFPAP